MVTVQILEAGRWPFLIPRTIEVDDRQAKEIARYRWAFPVFWLVSGPKGSHWCQAVGRRGAQTVYRHIPWDGPKDYQIYVHSIALQELRLLYEPVFWKKEAGQESLPWRTVYGGKLEPAPDGYADIYPHGYGK